MTPITHYNSILAAVEFKNIYKDAENSLRDNPTLKELGFKPILHDLSPYGVKMLNMSNDKKVSGQIQITPIRIQYEALNIEIGVTDQIITILSILKDIYSSKIYNTDEINFIGAVFQAIYKFEDAEMKKIQSKFFKAEESGKIEFKLNFKDNNDLNYNISCTSQSNNNELLLNFDLNSRLVKPENRKFWGIKEIVNKIKEYMENIENIKKILMIND